MFSKNQIHLMGLIRKPFSLITLVKHFSYKAKNQGWKAKSTENMSTEIDYSRWSKKQLIDRIALLEGRKKISSEKNEDLEQFKKNVIEERDQSLERKKKKEFDYSRYSRRKIALRFAYLGWNYQGLAIQATETALPTVEEVIMNALYKIKLIGSLEQKDCNFSRCGRTDKGVSAMNQVISLEVRSKLTEEELKDARNDLKELDYIRMINQALPDDIRIHSICLRPPEGFDARFSCNFRHYKYIFDGADLDIDKMNEAASFYLGDNDFRNFCKIDASKQIKNFNRTILKSEIHELPHIPGFFVFNLSGTAFLWHQVRCMVAVLLTVAQGHEDPDIVKRLLDISQYPSRPLYRMAHDIPLVLYDCGFDEDTVKWTSGPARDWVCHKEINGLWNDYKIKYIVTHFMKTVSFSNFPERNNKIVISLGDGIGESMNSYIPFKDRKRLDTAEEINAKWKSKGKKRKIAEVEQ